MKILEKYKFVVSGIYAALIALIVFAAFGNLSLSPIDEGSILAASRRLLSGQIPHLDFIWVRPPLSSLLHAPELILGGEYVLLLSRLIAGLQYAAVAWLGVYILHEELAPRKSLLYLLCYLTIAYSLTCAYLLHVFFAWATLDGSLLLIVGVCLLRKDSNLSKMIGFTLVGCACLAKQVFVIAIPLMWLLFGACLNWRLIACSLAPGIVYVLFLLFTEALDDAWLQLVAVGEGNIGKGLTRIFSYISFLGFLAGASATFYSRSPKRKILGVFIVTAMWAIMTLLNLPSLSLYRPPLTLLPFGAAIGVIVTRYCIDRVFLRFLASLVAIGWASSLSIGYPYPAWVSGILGVAVLMAVSQNQTDPHNVKIGRDTSKIYATENIVVILVLMLSVTVFVIRNINKHHSEHNSWMPTVRLDDKFPGASGIYTSLIMTSVYDDLQEFIALARSDEKKYAIVPDFYAWWIAAEQDNPLPIDWASKVELAQNNPALISRLQAAADALRPDVYFIIQKFDSLKLSPTAPKIQTWMKQPDFWWEYHSHQIVKHIRMHYELHDENEHFWLYK